MVTHNKFRRQQGRTKEKNKGKESNENIPKITQTSSEHERRGNAPGNFNASEVGSGKGSQGDK